jgi:PAS domain S-box-containing protein
MKFRVNILFQNTIFRYLFGVVAVVGALALRIWLLPLTGTGAPFVLFFAAVVVTSLFAGVGPGICAALLSMPLAAGTFVTRAGYSIPQASFQSLLFAVDASIVIYLTFVTKKGTQSVENANLQLRKALGSEQVVRRQAESAREQVRESQEKYRGLFDSIDEGFCVIEVLFDDANKALDYRFLEVNRVFEKQTGISNAVGRRMREIAPALEEHWFQIYGHVARTGESRRFENPAVALGRFYDVYAFRLGRPEQRQVAVLFNDITERKRGEEALRKTEELLRQGVQVGHLGIFEHDQITDAIYWSPEIRSICGWDPEEHLTLSEYVARIHPDDRERILAMIRRAHDPAGDGSYDVEHRVIASDGTPRWIRVRSRTFFGGAGVSRRPVRTVGALMDITENKEIERRRESLLKREQESRSVAEAANRMKDEFLAMLSHELRTPLTSILGWATILREKNLDPDTSKALETIERNARAQQRLIEDILDVSRILGGSFRLDLRPIDLTPTIEAAIECIRPAAQSKGIQLDSELDPCVVISGDPDRLLQVAENLLTNAVKFTPQYGTVRVSLRRKERRVELCVDDNGQGIDPSFLPYIFDRFRQADSSSVRKQRGLGLGLAITRHIVELHGGNIYASSPGKNQGAAFTIELPLLPQE